MTDEDAILNSAAVYTE